MRVKISTLRDRESKNPTSRKIILNQNENLQTKAFCGIAQNRTAAAA
jgi:hypothetical protein